MEQRQLEKDVIDKLSKVIDPETGADVIRMRLVQDIKIDDNGNISYIFRPSSPLCPLAVPLALSIMEAVSEVTGISHQKITVENYSQAETLTQMLQNMLDTES